MLLILIGQYAKKYIPINYPFVWLNKTNEEVNIHKFYDEKYILNSKGVPTCECGGTIKPDVVLYEEGLDENTLRRAISYISNCDMLIIGGTSLNVYPAAGLMDYYMGNKLVLINKDATLRDNRADLVLHEKLGDVFNKIVID